MMEFRDKKISFSHPKVMGIINVTPDSFSDGGKFLAIDDALRQSEKMSNAGATFIDIGGESTRPGAVEVSLDEELSRVIPAIEAIRKNIDCIISIDTSKATVMREAVLAGASLINDVRALSQPEALQTAAQLAIEFNVPVCVMHMQGNPLTMQDDPRYKSVVEEVVAFFEYQIHRLTTAGFHYRQIMLDPGFGFGKTLEHNYQLLKHFSEFTQFDLPVLAGMSRKSMIGNLLNKSVDNRVFGDVAAHTVAAVNGASVLRVHDVEAVMDAVKIIEKMNSVN